MRVQFARFDRAPDLLLCPYPGCGDEAYLHQGGVTVFNRSEDNDEGMRAIVDFDGVRISQDLAGNPSSRRHGLKIRFACEICGRLADLAIAQHKGQTEVSWQLTHEKSRGAANNWEDYR